MTALLLGLAAALLLANAIFVATEFALVAARWSRMQALATAGDARARTAMRAMRDLPGTLAAMQLGITMASIGLGFTAEAAVETSAVPLLVRLLPLPEALLHLLGGALALGIVVAAHVLLGEMVPKNVAIAAPERSALWLGPLVRPFALLVRPAVRLLTALANLLLLALRVQPRSELSSAFGVEDIADMLELAGREGAIHGADRALLDRAIRFANRGVQEVMVPWGQVSAIPESAPPADVERVAAESGHTRLPVVRDAEVLGFIHVLDVQRPAGERRLRPVLRVSRSRRLLGVFEELRHHSRRLAIVVDDDGRPLGLLTLEDLLDELLG